MQEYRKLKQNQLHLTRENFWRKNLLSVICCIYKRVFCCWHLLRLLLLFWQRLFKRKPARELLPSKPVPQKVIQPWWKVHTGFITEDDIKVFLRFYKLSALSQNMKYQKSLKKPPLLKTHFCKSAMSLNRSPHGALFEGSIVFMSPVKESNISSLHWRQKSIK